MSTSILNSDKDLKMDKIRLILIVLVSIIAISACEKVEQQLSNSDKAVLQGYLIPGRKASISISKEIAYASSDSVEVPIEGLEIIISNGLNSEQMVDKGLGVYESNTVVIQSDEKYSVSFEYNGRLVSAETTIPSKPIDFSASRKSITIPTFTPGSGAPPSFPEPIDLTWTNYDNRYYLVVVENIESNPSPIYDSTRYELHRFFRNEPMQTNFYELNMRSFNYYGTHRIILFNLNPEYAALYDDNGNTSLNLTTPPSNVEGGLGIFTGLNSDTINIEVY